MSDHAIATDQITKTYQGGIKALDGVTLEVRRGEILGLLGKNGAGKTTLVKILLDIVRPTSGRASLLGMNQRDARSRLKIGYLPEDHRFPEYRTAEETLDFYARLSGVPASTRKSLIPDYLASVGLQAVRKRKVRSFSKGMKQRLGLAQAVIHDPDLIFLDEPTDGVDAAGRRDVRELLINLKNQGKTIFLNSHLLGEVEMICDRVAILDRGRIQKCGTVSELTHVKGVYTLTVHAEPSQELWLKLKPYLVNVANDRCSFDVGLRNDDELDEVLAMINTNGSKLRQLTSKKLTLEDVFLSAIGSNAEIRS